jgi:hypothetical protein
VILVGRLHSPPQRVQSSPAVIFFRMTFMSEIAERYDLKGLNVARSTK